MLKRSRLLLSVTAVAALTLTACSTSQEAETASSATDTTTATSTTAAEAKDGDAVSVENCGRTVTFEEAPERVTLLNNPSVLTLDALGVLDRVVAKGGVFPKEYYDADINAKLDAIESISDKLDGGGHLQISREEVIATNPDLIIGSTDNVNPDTVKENNVNLVQEPALCGALDGAADWRHVDEHVDLYATIFGKEAEGEAFKKELHKRIEEVEANLPEHRDATVAVLWPTVGGGVTYAYGAGSMANALVESAGLTNIFADKSDRVFEVNAEQIVALKPDIILAIHSEGDPEGVAQAIRDFSGASAIPAVQNDLILPMLLNFAESPGPLNVVGLEKLSEYLKENL